MKNTLTLLAALFFVTIAAHAQYSTLPGDPSATVIATVQTTTTVSIDLQGKKSCDVAHEVMIWRTGSNGIALTLSTPSIAPSTVGDIDVLTTSEIYRQVAKGSIAEAIRLGHITSAQTTYLWHESNVVRNGSGSTTRFAACTSHTDIAREYAITFSNGAASIDDRSGSTYPVACGVTGGGLQ